MSRIPATAASLALAGLFLVSFGMDCRNLAGGGACRNPSGSGCIDLRNRVTGVRVLEAGRDPYHHKWSKTEAGDFCDPYNNPALPVSKTTVTPTMLLLHDPVAALPYTYGRFLWLGVQWACLLAVVAAGWRMCGAGRARWWWVLAVAAFTYTGAWRLHAERGQSYVVLAACLAWWIALTREARPNHRLGCGLLAGFLVALRPPFLFLLPFLFWRRRGQLPGLALGLAAGIGLPLLVNPSCWHDYSAAMHEWSHFYRNGIDPRPPPQAFPWATVEGLPIDALGYFADIPSADASLVYLLRSIGVAPLPSYSLLCLLLALFGAWHWLARRQDEDTILLGLGCWALLADFFLPALRNSYNDVLILAALAVAFVLRGRAARLPWLLLFAVPAGWWVYAAQPAREFIINLPTLGFVGIAVLGLVWPLLPGGNKGGGAARGGEGPA